MKGRRKHCKLKMLNLSVNVERFVFTFESTVAKSYAIHFRTLSSASISTNAACECSQMQTNA